MSKLVNVLFLGRLYTCIYTHAFFVFQEQDSEHITIMKFVVMRIVATLPWQAM